jgi:hypothetical protein
MPWLSAPETGGRQSRSTPVTVTETTSSRSTRAGTASPPSRSVTSTAQPSSWWTSATPARPSLPHGAHGPPRPSPAGDGDVRRRGVPCRARPWRGAWLLCQRRGKNRQPGGAGASASDTGLSCGPGGPANPGIGQPGSFPSLTLSAGSGAPTRSTVSSGPRSVPSLSGRSCSRSAMQGTYPMGPRPRRPGSTPVLGRASSRELAAGSVRRDRRTVLLAMAVYGPASEPGGPRSHAPPDAASAHERVRHGRGLPEQLPDICSRPACAPSSHDPRAAPMACPSGEVARESVELDGGGPPPRSARGAGSRLRILSSIEEEDHRRVEVSHEGAC